MLRAPPHRPRAIGLRGFSRACPVAFNSAAFAAEKLPLEPDTVVLFTTDPRTSATIEFSLRGLAADMDDDIPRRLATIGCPLIP
jgi:hypothetical protein